jgi:hypothetical protein
MTPAEYPALAVNVFRSRVDDTIGAECERTLVERRRKDIVDNESTAGIVRDVRNRRDIDDFQASDWSAFPERRLCCFSGPLSSMHSGRCHRQAST